jgi:hypothetical protein
VTLHQQIFWENFAVDVTKLQRIVGFKSDEIVGLLAISTKNIAAASKLELGHRGVESALYFQKVIKLSPKTQEKIQKIFKFSHG